VANSDSEVIGVTIDGTSSTFSNFLDDRGRNSGDTRSPVACPAPPNVSHCRRGDERRRWDQLLADRSILHLPGKSPLAKLLAVLPALAARPRTDFGKLDDMPTRRAEFEAGLTFTALNRNRIFELVCLSRLSGIAWSVLGGWCIYHWSRGLYGKAAGYLSLSLWCFEPYILGHAALVTTDVPAAVAGMAASYTYWRYLRSPSWRWAVLAGLMLGIAALTKFTLLVLYILWPFLWAICRLHRTCEATRSTGNTPIIVHLFLIGLISLDVINIIYGCQGTGQALGDYPFISRLLGGEMNHMPGNRFRGTWVGNVPVPLPEDFVRGIDVQRVDFEGSRPSYLGGTWSRQGWWYYYLYAMAVKLPLGTQVLALWGLAWTLLRNDCLRRFDTIMPLMAAATILIFVSLQTGYTQHSRYAIPALPYLMINAGRVVSDRVKLRAIGVCRLAWGLMLGTAISSLWVYPHSLSYFNEAAGGPKRGHDHLLDSNIDWGQDLLYLKDWLTAHPQARGLKLAYYNFQIDPALAGLTCELPPPGLECFSDDVPIDNQRIGPLPGYYAISVNFLRGAEFLIADRPHGFREVRAHEFEYFRFFRPIARAGYSIYIYCITDKDAAAVRTRLGLRPID
jgi:Dolichyl-phosphate-mannose-protein mannosyltransferase